MDKAMRKAIVDFVDEIHPMDARTEKLGRIASWDLWNGPITFCEECGADSLSECDCAVRYPGFETATREVSAWVSENLGTLYYDSFSGFVSESEPEGWEDEETGEWQEPEPYYEVSRRDVVAAIFGKELAEYVS